MPTNHMQLFLLIGQSNMAGRGKVESQDEVTNPHIFMLTKDMRWTLAKDPVHFDKPDIAGVGLCSEFARALLKSEPNITIGLIPCAMGGSSLDEWQEGGPLYNNAVERTREAMKNGALAGILWHQGEADTRHDKVVSYAGRFAAMIGQLRKDLSAEDVPLVIGELGHYLKSSAGFNAMVPHLASIVPPCEWVSAEHLTDGGDKLHFDAQSLRILGSRYAAAWLKMMNKEPAPGPDAP